MYPNCSFIPFHVLCICIVTHVTLNLSNSVSLYIYVLLSTWCDKTMITTHSPIRHNTMVFFFSRGAAAQRGPWPPHSWGFEITHNDASQSVGLLWTSDQLVAETSTSQHTTLATDKHPCPRWDSNPQSQQASGRRPTP